MILIKTPLYSVVVRGRATKKGPLLDHMIRNVGSVLGKKMTIRAHFDVFSTICNANLKVHLSLHTNMIRHESSNVNRK